MNGENLKIELIKKKSTFSDRRQLQEVAGQNELDTAERFAVPPNAKQLD